VAYWLFKSEPSSWSWEEQVAAGEAGTNWNGVRNHQAKLNLQAMRRGDRGFFYHSGEGKAIVGVVEVVEEYRPDPSDETGRFGMVDVRAVEALAEPVTLDRIKAEPRLKDMALVRLARLSVQPVTEGEWGIVRALAGN
jgi:predicted RNA-binding protein with PUA-like domain